MLSAGTSAADAMAALGIEKVDDSALEDLCREIVMANPKVIDDVQSGNEKAVGALIGQAKQKNPNVNPGQVRQICLDIINAL
jgi:aspartyl-tRNA(Asn)/glutamyl-tRNA(Gln) amidotransferase subunit B